MTTPIEVVKATARWSIVFTAKDGTDVVIQRMGSHQFAFVCEVEGDDVDQARVNMAALKAELQRVLDL